jgi:hypothetical protein
LEDEISAKSTPSSCMYTPSKSLFGAPMHAGGYRHFANIFFVSDDSLSPLGIFHHPNFC